MSLLLASARHGALVLLRRERLAFPRGLERLELLLHRELHLRGGLGGALLATAKDAVVARGKAVVVAPAAFRGLEGDVRAVQALLAGGLGEVAPRRRGYAAAAGAA
eukprot:CAMPEP_0206005202 /NCGR_PEP_ID=MMETSP1464-20131121/4436_1 /ASSEMBLY_ACC=CAM_ASM_001124 /TAXON_ID=119497 /ORGANISM="Exanthemachrysis gayraliae, Strain RCC1523" /LENGTH=105 /DNA_ID=CAMNT_0053378629 /DNA_START=237 /DNA_END=550 /DNA_ORIENTATION=-